MVILLHGWPYDIHSFVDVAPLLSARGYRVLIPYLRGYGTTRFLSPETLRNGQQAALAADCVEFMDALGIERAVVAGFDWGARTANIVAALWPQRCRGMVSVSGYLIGSREADKGTATAAGGARMVVPVLLRDRPGPRRVRKCPFRVCEAHLEERIAEVGFRRRDVQPDGEGVRQSGSCFCRDPQLSLAAWVG